MQRGFEARGPVRTHEPADIESGGVQPSRLPAYTLAGRGADVGRIRRAQACLVDVQRQHSGEAELEAVAEDPPRRPRSGTGSSRRRRGGGPSRSRGGVRTGAAWNDPAGGRRLAAQTQPESPRRSRLALRRPRCAPARRRRRRRARSCRPARIRVRRRCRRRGRSHSPSPDRVLRSIRRSRHRASPAPRLRSARRRVHHRRGRCLPSHPCSGQRQRRHGHRRASRAMAASVSARTGSSS